MRGSSEQLPPGSQLDAPRWSGQVGRDTSSLLLHRRGPALSCAPILLRQLTMFLPLCNPCLYAACSPCLEYLPQHRYFFTIVSSTPST